MIDNQTTIGNISAKPITMSVEKAAMVLQVSKKTIYSLHKAGRLPGRKIGSNHYLYVNIGITDILWTPKKLSYEVGISHRGILKMIKDGKITSIKYGKLHRISMSEASRLMTRRLIGNTNN